MASQCPRLLIAAAILASGLLASSAYAVDPNPGFRGKGAGGARQLTQILRQTRSLQQDAPKSAIQHFQKNQEFKSGAWRKSDHHFEVPGKAGRVLARPAMGSSTAPAQRLEPTSRQKLSINDPNNPSEVASGLRNRYQNQSESERRSTSSVKLTCPTCASTRK